MHSIEDLNIQNLKSRRISNTFFAVLRSILDSKYREFLMMPDSNACAKMFTKFPEFVYSWLGKFTIDSKTFEIRLLDKSEANICDEIRLSFFYDLLHPNLSTLWEIITFKEFLAEKASKDEIVFYLHCRNLLYEGATLNSSDKKFLVMPFVNMK